MNSNKIRWTLIIFVIGAGLYGFGNHEEHLAPYLPFAFLLGCLFMHVLMHSGHTRHTPNKNEKHESA